MFFILLELFTAFYSQIPEHMEHFDIPVLRAGGPGGAGALDVDLGGCWPWRRWCCSSCRPCGRNPKVLAVTCVMVFVSLWIDKGLGLIVGGFVPSPLGAVTEYSPTWPEISITLAIWAVGCLMITVFYKIALSVRSDLAAPESRP